MSPALAHALADLVLFVHAGVVAFNIFWMIAIPIGGWLGWRFVRAFWWRAAHVASLLVVAIQPLLGRYCFLTLWQDALDAAAGPAVEPNWLERIANAAVFWPLPPWLFVYLYIAAFAWTALLWWLVPPQRRAGTLVP
jgi:Protein of Unknown function (DUF2784)